MTADELQKAVDSHLTIVGSGEKFRMTVAKEEMIWDSNNATTLQSEGEKQRERESYKNLWTKKLPSQTIEIESLQNYIFRIENEPKADKLKLLIEDVVNRIMVDHSRLVIVVEIPFKRR